MLPPNGQSEIMYFTGFRFTWPKNRWLNSQHCQVYLRTTIKVYYEWKKTPFIELLIRNYIQCQVMHVFDVTVLRKLGKLLDQLNKDAKDNSVPVVHQFN